MNITLSADEKTIARARAYAQAQGRTLNDLIRDYMAQLAGEVDHATAAQEFAELARNHAGRSDPEWRFDRIAAHARGRD